MHDSSSTLEEGTTSNSNPSNSILYHSNSSLIFNTDLDILIAIQNGVRGCTKHPLSNFMSYDRINNKYKAFATQLAMDSIPKYLGEAIVDPRWKEAINEEMKALNKNQTWEISNLPPRKHLVGCKWVFTIKYKADGTIESYKPRLVAKGYM